MENILNKLESVQTNQSNNLNIKILQVGEVKTYEVATCVNRKWTTCLCDIYMQLGKGTARGKNGIITKKHDCKNAQKPYYSYNGNQWLFTYNDNIYNASIGRNKDNEHVLYISIPKASSAIYFHKEVLTPELVTDIKNYLLSIDYIKKELDNCNRIDDLISQSWNRGKASYETKKEELKNKGVDFIKSYILNPENWIISSIDKQSTWQGVKYFTMWYKCNYEGMELASLNFKEVVTELPARFTSNQKKLVADRNKKQLIEKLATMGHEGISVRITDNGINISLSGGYFTTCIA